MPNPKKSKAEPPGKSPPAKPEKSCEVYTSEAFEKLAKKLGLDQDERKSIDETLKSVGTHFGKPHLHQGLGIRDLGKNLYECRWSGKGRGGLHLRLVFKRLKKPTVLFFDFIGDHDAVRRYLGR